MAIRHLSYSDRLAQQAQRVSLFHVLKPKHAARYELKTPKWCHEQVEVDWNKLKEAYSPANSPVNLDPAWVYAPVNLDPALVKTTLATADKDHKIAFEDKPYDCDHGPSVLEVLSEI